jgi:hypothetical protein
MTGRIQQNAPALRRWLDVSSHRAEPERFSFRPLKVIYGKVEMHLLWDIAVGP